jgi:hypothetical protein
VWYLSYSIWVFSCNMISSSIGHFNIVDKWLDYFLLMISIW